MIPLKIQHRLRTGAVALLMAVCVPASHAQTATAASDNTLVGIWSWTLFNGTCSEALQYRADGVLLTTSGDAVTVWHYTSDPAPNAQGFYKVIETSVRYNSKKDCYGDVVDEEGLEATRFMRFSPANDRLIVCKSASLAECYGPLKREPSP